jgi:hypothetical protein
MDVEIVIEYINIYICFTARMAKHAELNLGKILSMCAFQDTVLLMFRSKKFMSFTLEM